MTKLIYKILNTFFHLETIYSGLEIHYYRWHLTKRSSDKPGWFLHHFINSDSRSALHDHPKDFLSIGIWGSYTEETEGPQYKIWRAPWIRKFPSTHIHKIWTRFNFKKSKPIYCWTLCRYGVVERDWGFYPNGKFVSHRAYLDKHGDTIENTARGYQFWSWYIGETNRYNGN